MGHQRYVATQERCGAGKPGDLLRIEMPRHIRDKRKRTLLKNIVAIDPGHETVRQDRHGLKALAERIIHAGIGLGGIGEADPLAVDREPSAFQLLLPPGQTLQRAVGRAAVLHVVADEEIPRLCHHAQDRAVHCLDHVQTRRGDVDGGGHGKVPLQEARNRRPRLDQYNQPLVL